MSATHQIQFLNFTKIEVLFYLLINMWIEFINGCLSFVINSTGNVPTTTENLMAQTEIFQLGMLDEMLMNL